MRTWFHGDKVSYLGELSFSCASGCIIIFLTAYRRTNDVSVFSSYRFENRLK